MVIDSNSNNSTSNKENKGLAMQTTISGYARAARSTRFRALQSWAAAAFALALLATSAPASADEVIFDDLIIDGSLCAGPGCDPEEVFDFDTIKIRADAPSLLFQDTSISAAFPTNDWNIGVRAGANARSVFYIEDVTGDGDVLQLGSDLAGGVALGFGSELVPGAISVGEPANLRRITHMADGVDPTDGATKGQLDVSATAIADGITGTLDEFAAELTVLDGRMTEIEAELATLLQRIDDL